MRRKASSGWVACWYAPALERADALELPLPRAPDRSLRSWPWCWDSKRTCFHPGCWIWLSRLCLFLHRTDGGHLSLDTSLQPRFGPGRSSPSNRLHLEHALWVQEPGVRSPGEAAVVCLHDPSPGPPNSLFLGLRVGRALGKGEAVGAGKQGRG